MNGYHDPSEQKEEATEFSMGKSQSGHDGQVSLKYKDQTRPRQIPIALNHHLQPSSQQSTTQASSTAHSLHYSAFYNIYISTTQQLSQDAVLQPLQACSLHRRSLC